jgi:hypothetical protein
MKCIIQSLNLFIELSSVPHKGGFFCAFFVGLGTSMITYSATVTTVRWNSKDKVKQLVALTFRSPIPGHRASSSIEAPIMAARVWTGATISLTRNKERARFPHIYSIDLASHQM